MRFFTNLQFFVAGICVSTDSVGISVTGSVGISVTDSVTKINQLIFEEKIWWFCLPLQSSHVDITRATWSSSFLQAENASLQVASWDLTLFASSFTEIKKSMQTQWQHNLNIFILTRTAANFFIQWFQWFTCPAITCVLTSFLFFTFGVLFSELFSIFWALWKQVWAPGPWILQPTTQWPTICNFILEIIRVFFYVV